MILVTIGTTAFDSLIKEIDQTFPKSTDILLQIADGVYKPVNFPFITFSNNIDEYYHKSELIICHAGAGTVYKLLEMGKKIIVVPNMTRSDPHQRELADFVKSNNYGLVPDNLNDIHKTVYQAEQFIPQKYNKPVFTGNKLLLEIIESF